MSQNEDVRSRMLELYNSARTIISDIESSIDNPYSAEGFYKIFAAGFLATPYLWKGVDEFKHPKSMRTKPVSGGVKVVDEDGNPMEASKVASIAKLNLPDARYNLSQRTIKDLKR